jgi:hypothetical protein
VLQRLLCIIDVLIDYISRAAGALVVAAAQASRENDSNTANMEQPANDL